VTQGHHDLSHHGKDPGKIAQLNLIEIECMKVLRELLAKLKQSQEGGETLLDRTMVYMSSNLGDASSHSTRNLPVLVAGGGFKHGQHLAFNAQNPPPLCNLYVSMLQRLGIEVDKFSTGSGTLTGWKRPDNDHTVTPVTRFDWAHGTVKEKPFPSGRVVSP